MSVAPELLIKYTVNRSDTTVVNSEIKEFAGHSLPMAVKSIRHEEGDSHDVSKVILSVSSDDL